MTRSADRGGPTAQGEALPSPRMERLLEVVQELSTARSLEGVQAIVRRAARELTGADGATVVLREGDQCFYADEDAIAPLWKGYRFPMSACISGWAMLHAESVVIEDIYADPRIPHDAYRPTFVRSLAMVPIRKREPIGAIGAYWAVRRRISESELRFLQALADSTSIAIENVTLLRELRTAKEAAEVASRLRDEFLAMVSHELRTPLNPILAWSSMLKEEPGNEALVREGLDEIAAGALLQLRQVDALLDVSQMIAGTLRLRRIATQLGPIVDAAIAAIAPEAASTGVLVERVPEHEPAWVTADPARLLEVAWNLLSNAVKFTPRGGTVTVSVVRSPSHVQLVIADTGAGIDADFMPHLFERFRQQSASMTRTAGGMGLGLAVVRHLVELHGGRVEAASPGSGLGATFTVSLPSTPPALGER